MKIDIVNKSPHELPKYETTGSAGMDIRAWIDTFNASVTIQKHCTEVISTGLYLNIPEGYEIQIRSRSGLAAKNHIIVANSPGTIDSDYHGEIKVILHNLSAPAFYLYDGDRIAQMVLKKVNTIKWHEIDTISESDRGEGGFGSTGIK